MIHTACSPSGKCLHLWSCAQSHNGNPGRNVCVGVQEGSYRNGLSRVSVGVFVHRHGSARSLNTVYDVLSRDCVVRP